MVDYDFYLRNSQRSERYRIADKTFVYSFYFVLEMYLAASGAIFLISVWMDDGALKFLALYNTYLVVLAGVIHHGMLVLTKPWLVLASATEAILLWALFEWAVSHIFKVPHAEVFCAYFFVLRYLQRGESEVNLLAYANLMKGSSENKIEN